MEEHRTVAPWCIANQIKYVEAPRREDGLAPLHIAAEQNKRRLVSRILELRACPDVVDNQGRSPLMVAALHGFTEIMVSLVKHGASHCVSDAFGRQALHYAAQGGENVGAAIDILIDAKADVDARDLRGATPLMGGASVQSSIAVDKLLLHGAGVFQVDYVGQRALHHARLGLKGEKSYRCWHEMAKMMSSNLCSAKNADSEKSQHRVWPVQTECGSMLVCQSCREGRARNRQGRQSHRCNRAITPEGRSLDWHFGTTSSRLDWPK
jgi:ankyrin repeat protein